MQFFRISVGFTPCLLGPGCFMSPLDVQFTAPDAPPSEDGTPPLADAYLRHRAWLTALLARRYGPDEAADIAQDTWLRIHRYTPPAPIRSPRSLLARIALNLAANRLRKTARETATDPGHDDLAGQAIDQSQEQAVFFEQMLLALPPKLRDVFALSHVMGLTYREIAQLRGISADATDSDPVAILYALVLGSSDYALRSMDNKAASIQLASFRRFNDRVGDRMTHIGPSTLIEAFKRPFDSLEEHLEKRDQSTERWLEENLPKILPSGD